MKNTKKKLLSAIITGVLMAPAFAMAVTNTYTINDPQEITTFNSGYDIAKATFTLDANDTLTLELFPYGVPGDADGDGDPNASTNSLILDGPGVGSRERITIGMMCDYQDGEVCVPNFSITITNGVLTTNPAVTGVTYALSADRYTITIPSVTALKQAVLGYVPTTVTFGSFNFSASYSDLQPDDFVPDRNPASPTTLVCEKVELAPPVVEAPGTGTIGYWKNHPSEWPANCDLSLPGDTIDTDNFPMNVLDAPVRGDKSVALAKQLVGAKLNVCAGNDSSCIASTISDAESWLVNYPVFSGQKSWLSADVYQELLDDYNNGKLCAPHRD